MLVASQFIPIIKNISCRFCNVVKFHKIFFPILFAFSDFELDDIMGEKGKDKDHFTFQKECLEAHNMLRKQHDCPPLQWSIELTELAQNWADQLVDKSRALYAEHAGVGENVALFDGSTINDGIKDISGAYVVAFWSKERDRYNFDQAAWQADASNFTQMIWKTSNEFGVGKSMAKDGRRTIVVAFYKPPGNTNKIGDFSYNVPKLTTI